MLIWTGKVLLKSTTGSVVAGSAEVTGRCFGDVVMATASAMLSLSSVCHAQWQDDSYIKCIRHMNHQNITNASFTRMKTKSRNVNVSPKCLLLSCMYSHRTATQSTEVHQYSAVIYPPLFQQPLSRWTGLANLVFFLHLFWQRICGKKWHRLFYRPDVVPATQPSAPKHWREQKALTPTSGLDYILSSSTTRLQVEGHCSIYTDSPTPVPNGAVIWCINMPAS